MKIIIKKIGWISMLCIAAIVLFLSSCEENDDLGTADRLFRPVVDDYSYGGTWIKLEWDKYEGAEYFILELSTDSFATTLKQVETDTTFHTFNDLDYDTEYNIRIKSIGNNIESEYFVNKNITTSDIATKLNSIEDDNIIDESVKVTWKNVEYDSLVVYHEDTAKVTKVITDEENAEKTAVIQGLEPATYYIVKAYANGEYAGKKSFTTKESQVFDGDYIDLRNLTEDEAYDTLSQSLFDYLAATYPDGVTVVLAGETHYEMEGISLTSPIEIVTGLSFGGNAVLEVKGNFNLPADQTVGYLRLNSLTFTDHADKPRTESNYGGTYLINISGSGSSLDEFSVESCDVRYKRGICRVKTGATLKAVAINDCFIDSIAGYGIVNFDNSGIVANSISVTNSTIAHTDLFARNSKMTTALGSMTITNVTTYSTPSSGKQFFRMGTVENVTISNCLFGAVQDAEVGSEGLSYTSITNSSIKNNYRTTDCTWVQLTDDTGAVTGDKNPIETTQLSTTSDETFADPASLDFTVTNEKLVNKIGDPRWW